MTTKLKLKLSNSDLAALNSHIGLTLRSQPMQELRANLADYLICSVLKELLNKTSEKVEDMRAFPTKRTDALYSLTITRSQALALACTILTDDEKTDDSASQTMDVMPFEQGSYEANFLAGLLGIIHQTFLV